MYRTIVADPPWPVVRSFGGANWRNGERARPDLDYPTMTIPEIASLPVSDFAEKDSHLYLWTTQGFLEDSFDVARAWGFRPVSTLVWCKPPGGFVGGVFFSNLEFVVFARKGKSDHRARANSQWFQWPRKGLRHSEKPKEFFDLAESISNPSYLEMFARAKRPGWDVWGNEVESDLSL
jgi:N6-adenosine-specific RNA methylase IME4